jgi:prepilin-type processing-associated H-X9-DG protein
LYAQDNEDKLYQSIERVKNPVLTGEMAYWMGASLPYYRDKDIRTCPSTIYIERQPNEMGNKGSTFTQWGPLKQTGTNWAESFASGSYCYNDWAACPPEEKGQGSYWGLPKAYAWKTITANGAANIPVFGDGAYLDAAVRTGDLPYGKAEEDRPTPTDGIVWDDRAINFYNIDRHNERVNIVFLDTSARPIGLKSLWTLKWNRNYRNIEILWPKWMRGMKD